MPQLEDKITQLRLLLKEFNQVLVCFSGGVDSGFLLAESVAEASIRLKSEGFLLARGL